MTGLIPSLQKLCLPALFVLIASAPPIFAQDIKQPLFELTPVEKRFQAPADSEGLWRPLQPVKPISFGADSESRVDSSLTFISATGDQPGKDRDRKRASGKSTGEAATFTEMRYQPPVDSKTLQPPASAEKLTSVAPPLPPSPSPVAATGQVPHGFQFAADEKPPGVTQTAATRASEGGTSVTQSAQFDTHPQLSTAIIDERRKAAESGDLADDVKAVVAAQYAQAMDMLRRAEDVVRKTAELRAERDNGPETLKEIRSILTQPPESAKPNVPDNAMVSELEQLRLADDERLRKSRKDLDEWEQRAKVRGERKPQLPALIDKTKQQLADARKSVQSIAPEGEPPAVTDARRTEQEALATLLQAQLNLYETERSRYDALNELFPVQRDLLTRNRNLLEKRMEAWRTELAEAGRRETRRQAAEARRKLQNAHPALKELAEGNAELIEDRKELQNLLTATRSRLDAIGKTLEGVESDFSSVKDKEDRAGLTTAIGILLRNQRSHLPDDAQYRKDRIHAESEMSRLQLEQLPLEDERNDLGDTITEAEKIVQEISDTTSLAGFDITEMTVSLLNDRKKYLDDLLADYDVCIKELAELDVRSRKLMETTQEYRNYIDERVLWIRSAVLINTDTPGRAFAGALDLVRPDRWAKAGQTLISDLRQYPMVSVSLVFWLVLLVAVRNRLRRFIERYVDQQQTRSLLSKFAVVGAVTLNLALASVWPLVVWLIGRQLSAGTVGEFSVAVGQSLKLTALVYWSIEVFRQICRPGGVAAMHLNWPENTVKFLYRRLSTLLAVGLPFVFAVALTEKWNDGLWADSLGRVLFAAGMGVLSVSIRRTLNPKGRVLKGVFQKHQDGWFYKTKWLWYPASVAVPLVLAGMAIAGWQYTAEQLLFRVELTLWLIVGLVIIFSMCMKWLISARKQLAMEEARARRAAMLAKNESQVSVSAAAPSIPIEEPKTDFSLLSSQMLKLTRGAACILFLLGSYLIWGEVLPALKIVDRVELWHTTVQVATEVETTEGQSETRMVTRAAAVTLGSLMFAIGLLGASVIASRNIPGLLELSVLKRLPLDSGGRNAITTLCRYALTVTGILLTAKTLGIGWSSVQWLLAALTVGLGFGLQEIFANFVSGLIILFERPVRIGDVVTIDDVSGSVSRIRIRATTITDFDRKEYIVPNKEFVTGRVLNWTLTDQTNRIRITVGVAYGTDTRIARSLLVKVASEHPLVLTDPEPIATFEEFGDSCLNLQLRCFISGLEHRLATITELHESIDREFKDLGLEIAFPQRDIHVRSIAAQPAALHAALTSEIPQSPEMRKAG